METRRDLDRSLTADDVTRVRNVCVCVAIQWTTTCSSAEKDAIFDFTTNTPFDVRKTNFWLMSNATMRPRLSLHFPDIRTAMILL